MMAATGQAPRYNQTQGTGIPRSILEGLNWPPALIEDYDRISQSDYFPLCGSLTPNGNFTANRSQVYFRILDTETENIRQMWFNPVVGVNTGWVQII